MEKGFFTGPKPRIFAHRGASGEAPENTLPAFRLALERRAPYAELDVHSSCDGHIVVIHDDTLERTTNGTGRVHDHTLKELKRLDAGYHFSPDGGKTHPFQGTGVTLPTLEEVFVAYPELKFVIEIKQAEPPIEEEVIAVVKRCGREKEVLLASEHNDVLARVRRLAPELTTSFSAAEVREFIERVYGGRMQDYLPPAPALQISPEYGGVPLVTKETVAAARALGVEVHVWTINDPQEMERLLNLGVDGIMSDWPGRLRETVATWERSRYNSGQTRK